MNSIDRINGFTPKRWGLKQMLRAAAAFGAHGLLAGTSDDPLLEFASIPTSDVLDVLAEALAVRPTALSVLWPWPVQATPSRVYVHAFDAVGTPVAFVKIALPDSRSGSIENEARMLEALAQTRHDAVRVPKLLATGTVGNAAFIAVEPLPLRLRALGPHAPFPETAAAQLAEPSTVIAADVVRLQPWWTGVEAILDRHASVRDMIFGSLDRHGLPVCRVHGDFSQKNILRDRSHLWVIDWETGALAGPRLVDELAFYLHSRRRQVREDPAAAQLEIESITTRRSADPAEARLGLAYLAAMSHPEADLVLASLTGHGGVAR